jgi:magnesium transporter
MPTLTKFYLSRIIGAKVFGTDTQLIGIVKDLLIDSDYSNPNSSKLLVSGIKIKKGKKICFYSFKSFKVQKVNGKIKLTCDNPVELTPENVENSMILAVVILDKQIVDLHGHKLVRVNDIQLVTLIEDTYVLAVDIGIEGLLRRIGIAKPIKLFLTIFNKTIPSRFILWEDVEAVDFSNFNIKLSKSYSKLRTLHPSDLADIIEDLGKKSKTDVFSSLDEEQAADVLEELETETQLQIIESLSVEKMADVLEKMPADEVADILNAMEDEKAELLLKEMEKNSSQEVRELLEYSDRAVGSIMSTDILMFKENNTIEEVINELRNLKPEDEELYNLFVTDEDEKLIATFTLRDIVLSLPDVKVSQIMKPSPVHLHDNQKVNDIAEYISKYNLMAIPVVNANNILLGMVGIGDVVDDLIDKRRTNK